MTKLKNLKRLSLTDTDVFLANLQKGKMVIGGATVTVKEAAIVISENGRIRKFCPHFVAEQFDGYSDEGYECAKIKFGGIFCNDKSFVLSINDKLITPDFAFIVASYTSSNIPFDGFVLFFSNTQNISKDENVTVTKEATLGTAYLECLQDVAAAFAIADKFKSNNKASEKEADSTEELVINVNEDE